MDTTKTVMPPGMEKYGTIADKATVTLGMYLGETVTVDRISLVDKFPDTPGASQIIEGKKKIVCSLQEGNGGLLKAVCGLTGCDFCGIDEEDSLDAAAELLNFISGAYAEEMSDKGIFFELMPPKYGAPPNCEGAKICRMDLSAGKMKLSFSFGIMQ